MEIEGSNPSRVVPLVRTLLCGTQDLLVSQLQLCTLGIGLLVSAAVARQQLEEAEERGKAADAMLADSADG